MAISRKNGLTMTAEVFLVLPLERAAGRAKSQRKDLLASKGQQIASLMPATNYSYTIVNNVMLTHN